MRPPYTTRQAKLNDPSKDFSWRLDAVLLKEKKRDKRIKAL